jgi:thiamine biosynthesis protein ThiS
MEGLGPGDSHTVNIWLNGEQKEIEAATVTDLVQSLSLSAAALLVEHNGLALRRDEWPLRTLHPDDRVEIIRIVAGG